MTATCVDTNVLLDILEPDPRHGPRSERALDVAAERGPLVIGPVTHAELAVHFVRDLGAREGREELTLFLEETGLRVDASPPEAALTAGSAYARFLGDRDPARVECPRCGAPNAFLCGACAEPVLWRAHILTDFLVGAHALHTTGVLLTRDRHLHRRIPGLRLVSP